MFTQRWNIYISVSVYIFSGRMCGNTSLSSHCLSLTHTVDADIVSSVTHYSPERNDSDQLMEVFSKISLYEKGSSGIFKPGSSVFVLGGVNDSYLPKVWEVVQEIVSTVGLKGRLKMQNSHTE